MDNSENRDLDIQKENLVGEEENFFSDAELDLNFEDAGIGVEDLISVDITDAVSKKDIKTTLLKEETEINELACIIDIDGYTGIVDQSFIAIEHMIVGGEYKVYIKNGEVMQGVGSTTELYATKLLPQLIDTLYGGNVKVLLVREGKVRKYNKHDVSIIRIKLR